MIKITNTRVFNLEGALRGMRNPLASWERSDSRYGENGEYIVGENDLALAKRLCASGTDHRKFIRQIFISADIAAPLYWWKEFDTYKVGTVANSTSTMHKLHSKPITTEDFSAERLTPESLAQFESFVSYIESVRLKYVETGERRYWDDLIQLLPSSFNQLRTVTMNYENAANMYFARKNHKLPEWHTLCDWVAELPCAAELILITRKEEQ